MTIKAVVPREQAARDIKAAIDPCAAHASEDIALGFVDAMESAYRLIATRPATGSPLYVIQINGADKQVIVGRDEHLYSRSLRARRVNLIAMHELHEPVRVGVKIRHRHEPAPALLQKIASDEVLVTFDEPQRAITPGQAAVFYNGDIVIGGGWIV